MLVCILNLIFCNLSPPLHWKLSHSQLSSPWISPKLQTHTCQLDSYIRMSPQSPRPNTSSSSAPRLFFFLLWWMATPRGQATHSLRHSELFKFNYSVFLPGFSISLNQNYICLVYNCVPKNVWHLKMVAISNQTLNFFTSKVEIIMDSSQALGEKQMRLSMSKSFINLTLFPLATQKVHRSAAAVSPRSWL